MVLGLQRGFGRPHNSFTLYSFKAIKSMAIFTKYAAFELGHRLSLPQPGKASAVGRAANQTCADSSAPRLRSLLCRKFEAKCEPRQKTRPKACLSTSSRMPTKTKDTPKGASFNSEQSADQNKRHARRRVFCFGGATQTRTGGGAFAELCLTTWLWRRPYRICSWEGIML